MKKKKIVMISLLMVSLLAGIYLAYLFRICPEIVMEQEELYGEDNKNLKDLQILNEGLYSTSGDPWIEYCLQEPIHVKTLEIEFSGIEENGLWGEIYNMDTWESEVYTLKNGTVRISYNTDTNDIKMERLRFDLVSQEGIYLEVGQVVLNSRISILFGVLKEYVTVLFLIISLEILIMQVCIRKGGREDKTKNRIKLTALFWGMAEIFLYIYNVYYIKVNNSLHIWMYLVVVANIFLILLGVEISQKQNWILESVYIFLYAIVDFGLIEVMSGIEYDFKDWTAGIWNVLIWIFVMLIIHLIAGKIKTAVMIPNILAMCLGTINHFFYQFRGNPFELSDLQMAGTAIAVIGNYRLEIDNTLFFCIIAEVLAVCAWCLCGKRHLWEKKVMQSEIVVCALLFVCISIHNVDVSYWNMKASSQQYGYINAFVEYARRELKHPKPGGYSLTKVENILSRYESEKEESKNPNIIVIMNESFADLPSVYEFETEPDGMPFIHGLEENTIKGDMLVSVFGGTTANTEYEFQTGNTMAFFNGGSVPYMQYVKRTQESITWELRDIGYETLAFHPYDAANYNRNKVYPLLGFDCFTAIEDEISYTDTLRSFVSDKADVEDIIAMYEQRNTEKPFYIFNVTMQNHGGYSKSESQVEVTVKPKDEKLAQTQLLEYLSLIHESDAAFGELVNYFKTVDEDTIILMFGDHQPGMDAEVYYAMDEKLAADNVTLEERMKMYTVPFVMWANYDIGSEKDVLTSPNYLRVMLLEKAGVSLSQYDQFLRECGEYYPAINFMGYYDANGNLYSADSMENVAILKEYQFLQYTNVFYKNIGRKLF